MVAQPARPARADTQPIHFSVPLYEPWMEGPRTRSRWLAGLVRPASRGTIRLSGPEPDNPLLIDPNALAAEADMQALVASLQQVREIAAAGSLAGEWGARELYPGPEMRTAAKLRDYVPPPAAGPRDRRAAGRRRIDHAAVTSGNTNAPSLMIGERVADFLAAG